MREYEFTFIAQSDLDEDAFNELVNRVGGWITEQGGEILKTELWGKRKLAYPIRKQTEGQYVYMTIKLAPASGAALERNLRFTEAILRFLLVVR